MLAQLLTFTLGLLALVAGAEALVRGASRMALSFGLAAGGGPHDRRPRHQRPEMAVALGAALDGKPDLAIGNVIGSNIANTLLILGVSAIIVPLSVAGQIIRQEVPILIAVTLLLLGFAYNGVITRAEAAVLLCLMLAYTTFLVVQSRRASTQTKAEFEGEMPPDSGWDRHWSVQLALVAGGLGLLVLGADWLVSAAVEVARALGVSDLVIGLTVVAIGTSMPEIATSILAALRGERDIAVGNVSWQQSLQHPRLSRSRRSRLERGSAGSASGIELRPLGPAGGELRLSAGLSHRAGDRPLGRLRVSRLLPRLYGLPHPQGAGARSPAALFQRNAGLRDPAHGIDARCLDDPRSSADGLNRAGSMKTP